MQLTRWRCRHHRNQFSSRIMVRLKDTIHFRRWLRQSAHSGSASATSERSSSSIRTCLATISQRCSKHWRTTPIATFVTTLLHSLRRWDALTTSRFCQRPASRWGGAPGRFSGLAARRVRFRTRCRLPIAMTPLLAVSLPNKQRKTGERFSQCAVASFVLEAG